MTDKTTPAFPALPISRELDGELVYQSKGLTIRDYFAAKAMQALIQSFGYREGNNVVIPNNVSGHAYTMADAMMEARK
jgi:hypothetical protein